MVGMTLTKDESLIFLHLQGPHGEPGTPGEPGDDGVTVS